MPPGQRPAETDRSAVLGPGVLKATTIGPAYRRRDVGALARSPGQAWRKLAFWLAHVGLRYSAISVAIFAGPEIWRRPRAHRALAAAHQLTQFEEISSTAMYADFAIHLCCKLLCL